MLHSGNTNIKLGALKSLRNANLYLRVIYWFLELQRRWPAMYIAITLSISALMLFAFSQLVWHTIFRSTMDIFDNIVIGLVQYFATPLLYQIMLFLTNLGYGYTFIAMVLLSLGMLAFLRRWLELQALVMCLMGGAVLNALLKHIFQRARPEALHLVEAWGYSFPSGHAMVSLCFYGMIAFLISRNIHSWRGRIAIGAIAVLLISGIGISRIYLGVHYPSDVIAGYAAGATWLAFSISLLMWWEQRLIQRR